MNKCKKYLETPQTVKNYISWINYLVIIMANKAAKFQNFQSAHKKLVNFFPQMSMIVVSDLYCVHLI